MLQLAAFLGNPGAEYKGNRHNAGRMLAEALPFYASLGWQKKFKGLYALVNISRILSATASLPVADGADMPETGEPPEKVHLLMPQTYMNLSGESVQAAAAFFKVKPEEIIVVHDELEIPLGTISLKFGGGLGGHNGLRSMKASFGTADFWRLRIGIGRPVVRGRPGDREPGAGGPPGSGRGVADWVLSDFNAAETEALAPALAAAAALLLRALTGEPQKLLPEWAKKKITF